MCVWKKCFQSFILRYFRPHIFHGPSAAEGAGLCGPCLEGVQGSRPDAQGLGDPCSLSRTDATGFYPHRDRRTHSHPSFRSWTHFQKVQLAGEANQTFHNFSQFLIIYFFHFQIDVLADLHSVANEESPSPSSSPVLHSKFYLSTADVKQRLTELQKRTMAKKLLDWVSVCVCSINAGKYFYPKSNSFWRICIYQRK